MKLLIPYIGRMLILESKYYKNIKSTKIRDANSRLNFSSSMKFARSKVYAIIL